MDDYRLDSIKGGMRSSQRLQEELAILIANTPPGERLPSEPELAKRYGTSRSTLREAMRDFERQGVIRRRQGVGTFVVSHTHTMNSGLEVLESIETLANKIELDVSMGDLEISSLQADQEQAQVLGLEEGCNLIRVERVILAEGRPVAFLMDLLPEDVLPAEDLQKGFTGSVLDLLLRKGSPELANSLTFIQAVAAPSEIAKALEIQRGDVLLCFVARLRTTDGNIIDYSTSYFLPGYFHFHVVRRVETRQTPSVL